MSEEPDFDTTIAAAWRQFSGRLCAYFIDMEENDLLTIYTARAALGQEELSLVVHPRGADAVIEGELLQAMTDEDRIALANQGWKGDFLGSGDATELNLSVVGDPDEVVDAVEVILREFRGVPHPSFLAGSTNGEAAVSMFDEAPGTSDWEPISTHTQLAHDVDVMLTSIMSHPPVKDEDGDVPFVFEGRRAYLRVATSAPVVELFTVFEFHPSYPSVAAKAAEYSHRWPNIKFNVGEQYVVAVQLVDCSPLIEEHLGRALGTFLRFFEDEAGDIAAELSREPSEIDLPPELQTIAHLDSDASPLTAEDVALICNQDRDEILGLLHVCAHHHQTLHAADRTRELLRSALRFVVLDLPRQDS